MGGRMRWAALGVVVVAAIALTVVVMRPDKEPVDASLEILDDTGRFATAVDASDAFAQVSGLLADANCDDLPDDVECIRVQRATAWAQVTAVLVIQCPPAAVFTARTELARYVRGDGELPATPRCGERR